MKIILVYITFPNLKQAKKIAHRLLRQKLIACGNIFPINSLYCWKNKVVDEKEFVLIGKTKENKFKEIKEEVEKNHPYSTPCVIKIPALANNEYYDWLEKELKPAIKK